MPLHQMRFRLMQDVTFQLDLFGATPTCIHRSHSTRVRLVYFFRLQTRFGLRVEKK